VSRQEDAKTLPKRLRLFAALNGADICTWCVYEAADAIERMQEWLEGDCTCPCCEGVRECSDGCTFVEDCPDDAEIMAGARAAMFGH